MDGTIAPSRDLPHRLDAPTDRPLGARGARRLITARLEALGRPPESVPREAREALVTQAHGSERHVQTLLATALFLADAERAPHIDVGLVARASALQPWFDRSPVPPASTRRPVPLRRIVWLAIPLIAIAGGLLAYALRPPAPIVVASHALPPPAHAVSTPVISTPVVAAAPHAAPQVPTVAKAPVPLRPAAIATPQWAPAPPPGSLILRFRMISPASVSAARAIAQRLQAAGFLVRMVPDVSAAAPRAASLRVFYAEDVEAAEKVKAALLLVTDPVQAKPGAATLPPPGTVELYLP